MRGIKYVAARHCTLQEKLKNQVAMVKSPSRIYVPEEQLTCSGQVFFVRPAGRTSIVMCGKQQRG